MIKVALQDFLCWFYRKESINLLHPLAHYQWFRRRVGGYWTRSNALGWQTLPDWSADMDLALSKKSPELYRNGLDVEDYREGSK